MARWRSFLRSPFAPALATAVLLYASFFPLNWGFLGWVALVPLLSLTVRPDPKRVYRAAWVGGLAFGLPATQWVRVASPPMYATWIGLALLISLHFLFFVWFTTRLVQRAKLPLILAAPVVWVGLEYARAHIGIGFAWYYLGHTQHDFLMVIQSADIWGAYGVSFFMMMANVVLWQLWNGRRRTGVVPLPKSPQNEALRFIGICFIVCLLLVYGMEKSHRRAYMEYGDNCIRIALLQPNIPQSIRNDPDKESNVRAEGYALADRAMESKPELIVWPETSFGSPWYRVQPNLDWKAVRRWWDAKVRPKLEPDDNIVFSWLMFGRWWNDKVRETNETVVEITARWPKTPLLLGVTCVILEDGGERIYNTAVYIDANGQERDRYHKMYRVPFGEYIPWEDTLPFMRWLSPYDSDYSIRPGDRYTVFELGGNPPRRFSVLICYEGSVAHFTSEFMRGPDGGHAPDFFLNISNDGWFRGTEEHEQHMVATRFRAIETRRSVARAVNMGISGVIDPYGRVIALPGPTWGESKGTSGVVVTAVPVCQEVTIYSRWGDVLPAGCWIIVAVGFVFSLRRDSVKPVKNQSNS